MTHQEIIAMAFDVGLVFVKLPDAYCNAVDLPKGTYGAINDVEAFQIEQFAALVAAKEREACTKLCDDKVFAIDHGGKQYRREATASQCADAIRARGGQQ